MENKTGIVQIIKHQINYHIRKMSFFIGGSSQYSQAAVDPEKIKLAEIQFTAMSTTFGKVLDTCRNKCIPAEYGESELNTGEQCCVDRCVAKYVKANAFIGTNIERKGFNPNYSMPEYQKVNSMLAEAERKQK